MAKTPCAICGAVFDAPPSANRVTCSKACSKIFRSRKHLGKRNVWNQESRKKLSARGQTDNLRLGAAAAMASPKSGAFETNVNAKIWVLRSPDNRIFTVRNLNHFIRTNPELFDGTMEQAETGIRAMRQWQTGKCKRPVTQWKGWELLDVRKQGV